MQSEQPFRKGHLQILRSLYDGQEDAGNLPLKNGKSLNSGVDDGVDSGTVENGANRNGEIVDNAETKQGSIDRASKNHGGATDDGDDVSEHPVGSEIWGLIARFLERRMEYRPHKERQIHWAKVNAEAKSRLDHLVSISSVDEEKHIPLLSRSSLTPRTPMFSVSGRGSMTPSLSLTPLSSNRNAPRLSQNDREIASTIPSWNLISQMLQRRSHLCTESSQSFRTQPFLLRVRDEADMRCKILERVLKSLKLGTEKQKHNAKKREGSATMLNPVGKHRKLAMDVTRRRTVPSSLGHFFASERSQSPCADLDDEIRHDEDSIMEAQMKLVLWSSLLSSINQIVE